MSEPFLESGSVVIDGHVFTHNEYGYLIYNGKPLGALRWGHPALVVFGEHYESPEAFNRWLKSFSKSR